MIACLNLAPWPLVTRQLVAVTGERTIEIGAGRDALDSGLMLTRDQNIVDMSYQVVWNVSNPEQFLFNLADPEGTIRAVAESAMRDIVATIQAEQDEAIRAPYQGVTTISGGPGTGKTYTAARLLALLPLLGLLGGCNMVLLQPSGDVALQQRNLIIASTGLMLLIIVPVIALTPAEAAMAWASQDLPVPGGP